MSKKKLSKKDVDHLATLSALELSDEEEKKYQGQLGETIDYVKNLEKLDTKGVEPTSHTVDTSNVSFKDGGENTRGLTQEEALQNAESTRDGNFATKRVIGEDNG